MRYHFPMSTDLIQRLRTAGYKITPPRLAVLEVIQREGEHLNPQEILTQAQAIHAQTGCATVYRTLELLTRLELVSVVYDPQLNPGYRLSTTGHHHHIVCQECHKALEFSGSDDINELVQRVEAETSFQVRDHLLQLFGLCPDCQQQNNKGKEI